MKSVRTSAFDPIRVDFVPQHLLGTPGRLGMTFAPGKKDHGMYATWNRDLAMDLGRLVDVYRTSVLVSLVEDSELALLSIPGLADAADHAALELVRRPFRDAGVPASLDVADEIVPTCSTPCAQPRTWWFTAAAGSVARASWSRVDS